MKYFTHISILLLVVLVASGSFLTSQEWGFFGHRKINRYAVFTCPPPLIGFYKKHIDYITEHAIDPDMRRHASVFEAIRHYIDIDHWDVFPFKNVPRKYPEAILKFGRLSIKNWNGTQYNCTVVFKNDSAIIENGPQKLLSFQKDTFLKFFRDSIFPQRYTEDFKKEFSHNISFWPELKSVVVEDSFSQYGILPFALQEIHNRLVRAFEKEDFDAIVKLSADYGHYVADAHVPLHTTENYNGQLTGQDGIHAFWESRLPELFAEKEYDFFVGKARYINDLSEYYWKIVLDSHAGLERVLGEEKRLRMEFPADLQYCYDERNGLTVRIQCPEFAEAYHRALGNMVEDRFRSAIQAIGNLWYTAWVEAGRPHLAKDEISYSPEVFDTVKINGRVVGRTHN